MGTQGRILTLLSVLGLTAPAEALALPIVLDVSQRVAAPRADPGAGLCGTAIHFVAQAMPLGKIGDAVELLDKPAGDPSVLGRVSRLFRVVNFRNAYDTMPSGDFFQPNFTDSLLPYSSDSLAMPVGDDRNIALRLRGYLNVKDERKGKVLTFAVNCDDACSLKMGSSVVFMQVDERTSGRVTRQVQFTESGLYPVEWVYYQNGSWATFEWSRADSAEPEGVQSQPLDTARFNLISQTELYSGLIGVNPGCQECGAPSMTCPPGDYCGSGLCQPCNLADHCGPACITCPISARICDAGKCKNCLEDAHCPPGFDCIGGMCGPQTPCMDDNDCAPQNKRCDPVRGICAPPPSLCDTDAMCPSRQQCDITAKQPSCVRPPTPCVSDEQCSPGQRCDTALQICRAAGAGCTYRGRAPEPGSAASCLGLLLCLLLRRATAWRRPARSPAPCFG